MFAAAPLFPLLSFSQMDHVTLTAYQICLMILIFTTSVTTAQSVTPNFSPCLPLSCGNGPKIQYPFWIPQRQEPHCGSPQFNITCHAKNPILRISDADYIVKNISYANTSILLAYSDVFNHENTCPTPLHNFSISGIPFENGLDFGELHFFYNCSFEDKSARIILKCASNVSHHSFAVFHTEFLKNIYSVDKCQATVTSPISITAVDMSIVKMNYREILRRGFVLKWNSGDCSKCVKSGGRCGSLDHNFICICNDQARSTKCEHKMRVGVKVGIALGSLAFGIALTALGFCFYIRRKKAEHGSSLMSRNISSYQGSISDSEKGGTCMGVPIFSYADLEKATNNFDSNREVGDGGFGSVYKGKLQDGRVVAVKRLYENNFKRVEQFMNEIEILTRLRHKNLVPLYGCTSQHCRQLLLVYEYVPNGTIADHLYGNRAKPGKLTWKTRMKIATETASALSYLHASDVIHRDVKTTNILLDNSFSVKVADFGLSRLFPLDATHVSTAPQGTPGYVDPEYHECYQLTDKSDVYSFGVVLIELISSMPAVDITRHRHEINLSNMAMNKIQNGALQELVDPNLGFELDSDVRNMITQVAELAFQCLQNGREFRPTMKKVYQVLLGIQSKYYGNVKVDLLGDDSLLLKDDSQILSPNSVTANWASRSTTTSSTT
ncbi:putative serine/threonine-protein kinase [Heracleum sosnowskyi]|uniref:non-specific serine/threonine protein kinase n=1 Tax=Heracleum sosnowskyi TaxID=360622 RepID=A0AAD8INE4_9APIA|nr:putative serine/threonine-protein kinase [Heracleum sosnowskyi]